jgi:hypothetical protein
MKAIGFRAEKDTIHYAIVEGTKHEPVLVADDKIVAPLTYSDAQAMSYFRDRIRTLVEQYKPSAAFVRYGETFLPKKVAPNVLASMLARARIEGVILESINSHKINIVGASLSGISSKLESKHPKSYLENGDLRGVDLTGKPQPRQEAILVAVSALEN